jgi:hypothetical protein
MPVCALPRHLDWNGLNRLNLFNRVLIRRAALLAHNIVYLFVRVWEYEQQGTQR